MRSESAPGFIHYRDLDLISRSYGPTASAICSIVFSLSLLLRFRDFYGLVRAIYSLYLGGFYHSNLDPVPNHIHCNIAESICFKYRPNKTKTNTNQNRNEMERNKTKQNKTKTITTLSRILHYYVTPKPNPPSFYFLCGALH